ncbi:MAG TPA: RsmD family RNA methyltransferase [Thermoanaerobaculia bacterium]|nr:RsmD family RNA methyltransferase [Thermoanaerobaculia bacterium]
MAAGGGGGGRSGSGRGRGVRVTGGTFRGRALTVPAGVRPTEGRVREALFSIWRESLPGCRFLDLFAGSGVVGLEAAGRGALRVVCVDQDVQAIRAIAVNAGRMGEALVETRRLALPAGLAGLAGLSDVGGMGGMGSKGGMGGVPAGDGDARAGAPAGPFDLVFADPPYRFDAFEPLLLALPPLLAPGAEVAVEHSARRQLPLTAGPLVRTGLRRYGESALAFYRAAE